MAQRSAQRTRLNSAAAVRLRTQFSWTLPANIIYAVCQFLMLVVLNKFGTDQDLGQFGLALAITAPVFMFAGLRLGAVLATDVRPVVRIGDYYLLRGWFMVAALVCIALGLVFSGQTGLAAVLILISLAKIAEAFSELCCGVQQKIERMDRIAISLVANGLMTVSAFTLAFLGTQSLVWGSAGLLIARIIVLVGYDVPALRRASRLPEFASAVDGQSPHHWYVLRRRDALAILRHALPLGITTLLLSLTSSLPRFLIAHFESVKVLGIFISLAAVLQGGSLIFRALDQPTAPRLA